MPIPHVAAERKKMKETIEAFLKNSFYCLSMVLLKWPLPLTGPHSCVCNSLATFTLDFFSYC